MSASAGSTAGGAQLLRIASVEEEAELSILFWNATRGSPSHDPQIEPTTNAQNEASIRIVIATRMYSPWLY